MCILADPSCRRSASVVVSRSSPECALLVIERCDYARMLRTISVEASHFEHVHVLNTMHLFRRWSREGTGMVKGLELQISPRVL